MATKKMASSTKRAQPAKKAAKPSAKKSGSSKSSVPSARSTRVELDMDSSLYVEEITNGYLVTESGTKGNGKNKEYYSKKVYSQTNPVKVTLPSGKPASKPTFSNKGKK